MASSHSRQGQQDERNLPKGRVVTRDGMFTDYLEES
jgi:hypothetical protein